MNPMEEAVMSKTVVQNGGTVDRGGKPNPDLLAELEHASRIANQNMAHQNAVAFQQAMFQLQLAAVGKCAQLILSIDPTDPDAAAKLAMYRDLFDTFMEKFAVKV